MFVEYNKLVRDEIPQIIIKNRKNCVTRTLDQTEYSSELRKKLREEVEEFVESGELDELADIYEVILALAEDGGHSAAELETARIKKHNARGGFKQRVFLVSAEK